MSRSLLEVVGTLALVLASLGDVAGEAATPPCQDSMSVTVHYPLVHANGSLWDPVGRLLYPPGTYTVQEREGKAEYKGCPCKLEKPCIRKCCPVGESMDDRGRCAPVDTHLFSPNVTDNDGSNPRTVDGDLAFGVLFGLSCGRMVIVDPEVHHKDRFFVRASDGSLSLPLRNFTSIQPADFCLDYVGSRETYLPLLCDRAKLAYSWVGVPEWFPYVFSLLLLLSSSFLMVTFVAFALTPDLRRSLHGKGVMCLVTCLIMGYVFLAMVQLAGKNLTKNNCIASACVMQFSFHAAFFWLNVLCFDGCWAFRGLKPTPSLVTRREERRFIKYSTYAWTLPLLIVFISILVDIYPHESLIQPNFGQARCWFFTRGSALVYFYTPMAILLTCNLIMLVVTALKIARAKKEPAILRITGNMHQDEIHQRNTRRYVLYLKLFIIMSINWVMELISWYVGGPDVFWYICDVGYAIQGVSFFIILVWKDRLHHVILKRIKFCQASNGVPETVVRVI
ncbi:probable G-protein coupled receptor Mth-like 1 [Ischnura elegans]|uniref:probable G-protein coupled receptor Mth-like 1 n=1 Tax=Ischnura elegans TaxID=197161 RepID=UPI001ED87F05|nr:probable G-protein coupled receptor Mth-like 1 [Ischnura elegans]